MLLTQEGSAIGVTLFTLFCCVFSILIIFFIAKAIKKHFSYKKQLLETQQQILTELKRKQG